MDIKAVAYLSVRKFSPLCGSNKMLGDMITIQKKLLFLLLENYHYKIKKKKKHTTLAAHCIFLMRHISKGHGLQHYPQHMTIENMTIILSTACSANKKTIAYKKKKIYKRWTVYQIGAIIYTARGKTSQFTKPHLVLIFRGCRTACSLHSTLVPIRSDLKSSPASTQLAFLK